jgi:tripartite-type tricarboxylate transporter receptor subunit TctC
MVVAPVGTPTPVVERLHGEMKEFMVQREIRDQIAAHGMLPVDTPSVANLQIFVRTEIARWGKMVEQAGIAGSQ